MDRLTRPGIDADQTAVRFMDGEVKIQDIGDKLLELILNGPTINGIKKDTLRHLVRQLYDALKPYEELDMTPEDIEQTMLRFSSFLMEMTGGSMSKTNYTVQAMVSEANDYQQKELEEAEEKGYDLGVESVLRNHFDIPWAEAADLRKNIDHLRELLVAEKEGRLDVRPPCKIGDTIYVLIYTFNDEKEMREATITGFRRGTHKQYVTYRYQFGRVPFESSAPVDTMGKTWFISQEEAKAALAKDNNVPGKTATDTNVGSKEEE